MKRTGWIITACFVLIMSAVFSYISPTMALEQPEEIEEEQTPVSAVFISMIDEMPALSEVKSMEIESEEFQSVCADIDTLYILLDGLDSDEYSNLESIVGEDRIEKYNDIMGFIVNLSGGIAPLSELNGDKSFISSLDVDIIDGLAPWGATDAPGSDSGNSNKIVRSYDMVIYNIQAKTALYSDMTPYEGERIKYEVILPITSNEAEYAEDLLGWADTTTGYEYTITDEIRQISGVPTPCQVLTIYQLLEKTATNPFGVPGSSTAVIAVNVKGMAQGSQIKPIFNAVLEGNTQTGSCLEHGREELVSVTPDAVSVSAKVSLNVSVYVDALQHISDTLSMDFTTGNANALDQGVFNHIGQLQKEGIEVAIVSPDDGVNSIRGCEMPTGPIEFNLKTNATQDISGTISDVSTNANYYRRVWSYDGNNILSTGTVDARDQSASSIVTCYSNQVPFNTGNSADSCFNGGDWNMTRTSNDMVKVSISNYQIDLDAYDTICKQTANGSGATTNKYIISAGEMYSFYPEQTFSSSVPSGQTGNLTYGTKVQDLKATGECGGTQTDSAGTTDSQPLPGNKSIDFKVERTNAPGAGWVPGFYNLITYEGCQGYSSPQYEGKPSDISVNTSSNSYAYLGQKVGMFQTVSVNETTVNYALRFTLFDADYMEPTGEISYWQPWGAMHGNGNYTLLYLTKSDGSNWTSETEMINTATSQDVTGFKVYSSLSSIPATSKCIGTIVRFDGALTKGLRFSVTMRIKSDSAIVDTGTSITGFFRGMNTAEQIATAETQIAAGQFSGGVLPASSQRKPSNSNPVVWNVATQTASLSGNSNKNSAQDALWIRGAGVTIDKEVLQKTDNSAQSKKNYVLDYNEYQVDYVLEPGFVVSGWNPVDTVKSDVVIQETLPDGIRYKTGSAYYGGTYTQNGQGVAGSVAGGTSITPVISYSGLNQILTWTLTDLQVNQGIEKIYYTAEIQSSVVDSKSFTTTSAIATKQSEISAAPYLVGRTATETINAILLRAVSYGKIAEHAEVSAEDPIKYSLWLGNNGVSQVTNQVLYDLMPLDGRDTSSFAGSYEIQSLTLDPAYVTLSNLHFYYTENIAYANSFTVPLGTITTWTEATIAADGSVADVVGKRPVAWAVTGTLKGQETILADVEIKADSDVAIGDIFNNAMSVNEDVTTKTTAETKVISKTKKTATIKVKKVITNYTPSLSEDMFSLKLTSNGTGIGQTVLKHGETSGAMKLKITGTSMNIDVSETVPMEYDKNYTVTIENEPGSTATVSNRKVTIHPGDEVTIVVNNTFTHEGYFKANDSMLNHFENL